MRTLRQIAGEMQELASIQRGDREAQHARADELLLEALRTIPVFGPDLYEVQLITVAWERVEKWYA